MTKKEMEAMLAKQAALIDRLSQQLEAADETIEDGPVVEPTTVAYGNDDLAQVSVERYQGNVQLGIRRGFTRDGEAVFTLDGRKAIYIQDAETAKELGKAILGAVKHLEK